MVQERELLNAIRYLAIHADCWKMHVEDKVTTKCKTSYDREYLNEIQDDIDKAKRLVKQYYDDSKKTIH